MSGRKITLALFVVVCVVTLYLNYNDNTLESKGLPSKYTKKNTEENDKLLSKTLPLQSEKVQTTHSDINDGKGVGVFECLPDFSFDEEARRKDVNQYFQSLSGAFSGDSPMYYALYATPPAGKNKLDLLFDYYDHYQYNPIVSMNLISLCVNSSDKRCTMDVVNDAVASDGKNGAIWVNALSYYTAKKDDARVMGAIDALKKTAVFNERFGESAMLYAQALEGSTSNNFNMNAIAGVGGAASSVPMYQPITQWCKEGLGDSGKADACLVLGEQLEVRSKTLISKAIGIALQSIVHESHGNTEAVQLMKDKRKEMTLSSASESHQRASAMMMLDERLLRSWLSNVDSYGELGAQQLLVEEAEVLYEENENYLCTLVYEVLDGF